MQETPKSPVIGFIRYSCRASFSEKQNIFDKDYLAYRFEIFTKITLKSFQEQSDQDFQIFVLHSASLPGEYKQAFRTLEERNPFLRCIYIPDTDLEGADYINAVQDSKASVNFVNRTSVNFRIDNDDALPRDYIAALKTFLHPQFWGFAVSIPRAAIIQRVKSDVFVIQEKYYPFNSMGLAYVTGEMDYRTIMTLGDHGKINQTYPVIFPAARGGLQTINGKNIMNALDLGRHPRYGGGGGQLAHYFHTYNYPEFDMSCLAVVKRRQFFKFMLKAFRFILKRGGIKI
jgi:hypothetical protein